MTSFTRYVLILHKSDGSAELMPTMQHTEAEAKNWVEWWIDHTKKSVRVEIVKVEIASQET